MPQPQRSNRRNILITTLLATFAIAALPAAAPAAVTWEVADGGNGHSYEFVSGSFTWTQARDATASMTLNGESGYLVTITSQGEQDFLFDNVTTNQAWTGASDSETEGTWKWVTGPEAGIIFHIEGESPETQTYANWRNGEPNDFQTGEDFGVMNWEGQNQWNDAPGDASFGYVVEFDTNVIPEPATLSLLGLAGLGATTLRRRRRA